MNKRSYAFWINATLAINRARHSIGLSHICSQTIDYTHVDNWLRCKPHDENTFASVLAFMRQTVTEAEEYAKVYGCGLGDVLRAVLSDYQCTHHSELQRNITTMLLMWR